MDLRFGSLEPALRDDLGARWVRIALLSSGAATAACLAAAFALGLPGLWALGAVGAFVQVSALVLRLLHRLNPTSIVLSSSVAALVVAPFTTADVVSGLVTALAVAGFVVIGVFKEARGVLLASLFLIGTLGGAIWLVESGWAAFYLSAPLAAAAVVTVSLVGRMRDHIAERGVAVENRDRRFRDLFDRMPVGLYRTAVDGTLLDANQALADLVGAPLDELVGSPVQPFLVGEGRALAELRSAIQDDGSPHVSDLQMRRADGRVIWIRDRTRAARDGDGSILFFEGELQDITQQIQHVRQLEDLVRSKSDLIAAVSHELRTPLTAVVGFLDVLRDQIEGDEAELIGLATEQAHEVAAIVEDLLTAARLDNQELVVHSEPVDLGEAVQAAIRSLGSPFVVLRIPLVFQAVGDGTRIRQILRNLIGNAQRYGRPPIAIRGDAGDGRLTLVVADKGDPIPAEVTESMFEPFYTTGSAGSQPGSIGLGLAVSRLLARRMGGDLTHVRIDDETRFVLELPAAGAGATALAEAG